LRASDDAAPIAVPRTTAAAARVPLASASLVIVMSVARLALGWSGLPTPAPGSSGLPVIMVPATAVGLILGGIGLLLLSGGRSGSSRLRLLAGRLAALAAAALGLVVLGEYLTGLSAAGGRGTLVPGAGPWALWPAPNTALALALLGGALLAHSARSGRVRPWAGRAAAAALLVSLTALIGHAYGATTLYGFTRFGGMALSTAVALSALAVGVLFADPKRGIAAVVVSDSAGGRLLRRLVPVAILIPPLLGWLRVAAQRAGLVDTAFGSALLVVSLIVVFVGFLVPQAMALHSFDTERARLHAAERAAHADAEAARLAAERARRAAVEADQAKSAFLATMSHEIRTPINAQIGYAQLMELGVAGPVTDKQREYLARLTASSEHLRGLVEDVLDLAKIDAGGMSVARAPGLTGPLVATALDLVRPQAGARAVRLVDERADEPGEPFVGDEHRVRQILVNLLSNAVKFTEPGGTVTIACGMQHETPRETELRGGGHWTFVRVADTGIGIARDEQGRIFDPFHQVEHGHTRRQGGTGLGLAISRRLARLMGGDLTVVSTPGVGSAFTLWLPAATEAPGGTETPAERGARAHQEPGAGPVRGLADVGTHLRERVEDVIAAYAARLRADPAFPQAVHLRRSELEDHQLSFLADVAQTLVAIEDAAEPHSDLLRDGTTIQRVVAELHGAMRQRRGWTEEQLAHEYAILGEEMAAVVRRRAPGDTGDPSFALEVLERLVERARASGLAALRRAAESGDGRSG
jgi:signal transduction histidine kinase